MEQASTQYNFRDKAKGSCNPFGGGSGTLGAF